jgi:hypothetical protein
MKQFFRIAHSGHTLPEHLLQLSIRQVVKMGFLCFFKRTLLKQHVQKLLVVKGNVSALTLKQFKKGRRR